MQLAARMAAWAGGVSTARDYVQDGLVAMFDGIENAGNGIHTRLSSQWKNLAGSENFVFASGHPMTFTDKALVFPGNEIIDTNLLLPSRFVSCEFIFARDSGTVFAARRLNDIGNSDRELYFSADSVTVCSGGKYAGGFGTDAVGDGVHSYHVGYSSDNQAINLFIDGIARDIVSVADSSWCTGPRATVGGIWYTISGGYGSFMTGSICGIRTYNRLLTAVEIASNYAIDKERFGL